MTTRPFDTLEWVWRQDMWRRASGERRNQIAAWNAAWRLARYAKDFPDFEEYISAAGGQPTVNSNSGVLS